MKPERPERNERAVGQAERETWNKERRLDAAEYVKRHGSGTIRK